MPLMMVPFVTLPCERDAAQPHQHPGVFKACLHFLAGLFILTWILAGKDEKLLEENTQKPGFSIYLTMLTD